MKLDLLEIKNFRNIKSLNLKFGSKLIYIYGPNGSGKTNLLEAIQILSTGKSQRSNEIQNFLPIDIRNNYNFKTIIKGYIYKENINYNQKVEIENNLYKRTKKTFTFNNNKIKHTEYIGKTPSIWFGIENIKVLTSSPEKKRKFIDEILIQINPEYYIALKNYEKCLKNRNILLKQEKFNQTKVFDIWTEKLILYGSYLIEQRKKLFNKINFYLINNSIFNEKYKFRIKYKPNINIESTLIEFEVQRAFEKNLTKDIKNQTTTIGPHKDNWESFFEDNKSLQLSIERHGSRGQQRMSLIFMIYALIFIFQEIKKIDPILLLDDVFSELDKENIKILLKIIEENKSQVFISGIELIPNLHYFNFQKIDMLSILKK